MPSTSLDSTEYFYSLPSNRIELWFLMESQRFLHPVFREFYKERDVVMEERRMRIESNPQGKLLEDFLATAFAAHPYRNPGVGWPSDMVNLRRNTAREFFDKYYVPANINIAIVGDVNPAEARRMAEQYFGPLPARPLPPLLHTVEPPQPGPKTAIVDSPGQPLLFVGYKRPDQYDPDDAVFDVIQMILSSGRTGLLYKELVQEKTHRRWRRRRRPPSPMAATPTCSFFSWCPRWATPWKRTRRRWTICWCDSRPEPVDARHWRA